MGEGSRSDLNLSAPNDVIHMLMRWFNISYNDKKVRSEVEAICGSPFPFFTGSLMGGTGSPRLHLLEGPVQLLEFLDRPEDRRFSNAEIRSNGILIRCRHLLETIGIPLGRDQLNRTSITTFGPGNEPRWNVDLKNGEQLRFAFRKDDLARMRAWIERSDKALR